MCVWVCVLFFFFFFFLQNCAPNPSLTIPYVHTPMRVIAGHSTPRAMTLRPWSVCACGGLYTVSPSPNRVACDQ